MKFEHSLFRQTAHTNTLTPSSFFFFLIFFSSSLLSPFLNPEAISDCDRAVSLDPSYHKARLRRAELLLSAGEFDAAVRAFQALKDAGSEDASVRDGLRRAKVALKKSKRKNYYAILGISETATAVQIKKGYRMAALKVRQFFFCCHSCMSHFAPQLTNCHLSPPPAPTVAPGQAPRGEPRPRGEDVQGRDRGQRDSVG
jgi:tetratricopeptide (TPR) repeat protein